MLEIINQYILGAAVPAALIAAGIFFMFRLKFFNIRHPGAMIRGMMKGGGGPGMTPVRAVSLALAGTLGVGNIVGVASAIYLGGFGAVFWMWVSALAAMLLKYAETVIALGHRRTDEYGVYHGGAMYYIKDYFTSRGRAFTGAVIAVVFCFLCIINALSMGCVIQVNAVSRAFLGVFGFDTAFVGGVFTFLATAVIVTGSTGIAKLTERLVPFMTVLYIVLSLAVMLLRPDRILPSLAAVFENALTPRGAGGGVAGYLIARGVRYGVMRGLMSNEAGCGTAPIAHAGSTAKYPAEQGFWGIFEVFVDTILLCSMTAVVIIISYTDSAAFGADPMMMTVKAYSAVLGPWSEYVMCLLVLFFGFATVTCWAHYGIECVRYLSGNNFLRGVFIAVYAAAMLVGSVSAPESLWGLADFALGMMTVINLAVICPMSGEVAQQTEMYLKRYFSSLQPTIKRAGLKPDKKTNSRKVS